MVTAMVRGASAFCHEKYFILFMAKSDVPRTMAVTMQEAGDPYTQYLEETVNLSTTNQSFEFLFNPALTDPTNKLKFFVGLETNCLYIDSVVFKEVDLTGIANIEDNLGISVYPNPSVSGKVTVEMESGERIGSIELIDLQGRLIKTIHPEDYITEINVSTLKEGMYFLRIQTGKILVSKKIIIQ